MKKKKKKKKKKMGRCSTLLAINREKRRKW